MIKQQEPFRVQVIRGKLVESEHQVLAAFWSYGGSATSQGLIGSAGNPETPVLPRSAIKMLQALPLVESGALAHYQLTQQMLAVACSSHHGEEIHLNLLREWMDLVGQSGVRGLQESALACGPHMPYNVGAAEDLIRQRAEPCRLHNNCSGKHFGFLTTSLFYKEDLLNYHREDHPSQRRVRQVLSETMGLDLAKTPWGVDGCGIPTYGIPLQNIARGIGALADENQPLVRRQAAAQIREACFAYPALLSGSKDWATAVIQKAQGQILLKVGAEGVLCGLLPKHKVSFALKSVDGNGRAVQALSFEILKFYGVLSEDEATRISDSFGGQIKNTLHEIVGTISVLTKK